MPSTESTIAGAVFASSFLCVYSSYAKSAAAVCIMNKHRYLLDTHLPFRAAELIQNKVNEVPGDSLPETDLILLLA